MDDREFTRRLEESAGSARPSDVHRRVLRMQLDHELRRHRRPRRRLRLPSLPVAVAAGLVGAVLLVGLPDPVGSDGFGLVATGVTVRTVGGTMLRNPVLNTTVYAESDSPEDVAQAEAASRELRAGEYDLVGMFGYICGSQRSYTLGVRPWVSSSRTHMMDAPGYEGSQERTLARISTKPDTRARFYKMVMEGGWPSEYHTTAIVAGVLYDVTVSYFIDPDLGAVGKFVGDPVR
ncbi:MAG TPA: hypothetical protein PLQ13_11995 [Candidatus Krumholzibacteria bacterium]|nr:hypothetical protein [Candidatus Krumholzibacteria bacterium]